MSKDDVNKIKEINKIADVVELSIYFNENQQGQGIKILTTNQMLSRLRISLPIYTNLINTI